MSNLPMRECFPEASVLDLEDGDVLVRLGNYPLGATMCLPMDVAIELATQIMCIANKQLKEAA